MNTKTLYLSGIIALAVNFGFSQESKKQQDIKSIKAMCGCYEVKFNFAETFYPKDSTGYKPSKPVHAHGLEWVEELVEDNPNKIILQHLLIVGDTTIVKHWRQDWLYENQNLYSFFKDNTWKFSKLPKDKVKGQWTQKVYQVDDSPRYEGTATWVHVDGKDYWVGNADAPLPRREEKRTDYNVLKRRNIHEIVATGWNHEQDNSKVMRDDNGKDVLIAEEKGLDVYTKVPDSKCIAAQKWWEKNKVVWKNIRDKWNTVLAADKDITLKDKVNGKSLLSSLFHLKPNTKKAESDAVIDSFVVKNVVKK